jgi:hypothetical protein
LCVSALLAGARGLVRHNTWYLASDQFAFLTFADDLARGTVFHDTATVATLVGPLLPKAAAADAYYQTYIFRDGHLYSRYPPGYPLLLAAVGLVGGETARHWLNPVLYLALIVVLGRLAARLVDGPPWAAAAAAMWAVLVIPVEVHYWGITIARDLPAHLLALLAVLRALSAAPISCGLCLGLAATIRPDAALWAIPAALVVPRAARTPRTVMGGGLAFAAGLLPLFAYNTITQGHPLAFTQGSEFRDLLRFESALGAPALFAQTVSFVSGGGFKLANFPKTFPVLIAYLSASFGAFLWIAAGFLVLAAVRRRPIAGSLGAYVVIGLLFYSCWGHGDPRYLVGVSLSLIVATAVALVRIAEWLSDARVAAVRRLAALIVVAAALGLGGVLSRDPVRGRLTALELTTAGALLVATATSLTRLSGARTLATLTPALAFASLGFARMFASTATPDPFREADVARARAAIEAVVPPGSLVLTSGALGRPAENWTYYTDVDAHYLGELPRIRSDPYLVGKRCTDSGRRFFLLLAPADQIPMKVIPGLVAIREVARRDAAGARDWFLNPRIATDGAVLYEAKVGLNPRL